MSIHSRIVRGVGYGALAVATLGFITPVTTVIEQPVVRISSGGGSFQHYNRENVKPPKIDKLKDESMRMAQLHADDEIILQLIINATLSNILD
jgi:hypothetical protein